MTFSQIQRRAFLMASAVLLSAVALILCYWQGVRKGAVPSPVQPIGGAGPTPSIALATVGARPAPAAAAAASSVSVAPAERSAPIAPSPRLERAPQPAASPQISKPLPAPALEAKPLSTVTEQPVQPVEMRHESVALAVPKPPATVAAPQEAPAAHALPRPAVPTASAADLNLARSWLDDTNQRPVIRVHYELAQVLKLAELGRGAIVASSTDAAPGRELYLQSKSGLSPLFAPYTEHIAGRFSTYSLVLEPTAELGQLTGTMSLYFPNSDARLSFVPDRELASQIFLEVAKARPHGAAISREHLTAEGQLSVEGAAPSFKVIEVRVGESSSVHSG